jgi:hypothetical protein
MTSMPFWNLMPWTTFGIGSEDGDYVQDWPKLFPA